MDMDTDNIDFIRFMNKLKNAVPNKESFEKLLQNFKDNPNEENGSKLHDIKNGNIMVCLDKNKEIDINLTKTYQNNAETHNITWVELKKNSKDVIIKTIEEYIELIKNKKNNKKPYNILNSNKNVYSYLMMVAGDTIILDNLVKINEDRYKKLIILHKKYSEEKIKHFKYEDVKTFLETGTNKWFQERINILENEGFDFDKVEIYEDNKNDIKKLEKEKEYLKEEIKFLEKTIWNLTQENEKLKQENEKLTQKKIKNEKQKHDSYPNNNDKIKKVNEILGTVAVSSNAKITLINCVIDHLQASNNGIVILENCVINGSISAYNNANITGWGIEFNYNKVSRNGNATIKLNETEF